jgi:hypothetical protein
MGATFWVPLLHLEMFGNFKGGSVRGTAGRTQRLAKGVDNTGYSHSEREWEKHDSLKVLMGFVKVVQSAYNNNNSHGQPNLIKTTVT